MTRRILRIWGLFLSTCCFFVPFTRPSLSDWLEDPPSPPSAKPPLPPQCKMLTVYRGGDAHQQFENDKPELMCFDRKYGYQRP